MNEGTYGNDQKINDTFLKMADSVLVEGIYEQSRFVSSSFQFAARTSEMNNNKVYII